SRQTTETPDTAARPNSSCASSIERPVASDWAEAAWIPAASNSVSDALKTFCTPPMCSTRLRPRLAPNPGVKDRASQCKARLSLGLEITAKASGTSSPPQVVLLADSYTREKPCQG